MGFFSTIFEVFSFDFGISIGLTVGYVLFIYFQPTDVEDPKIKPLADQDAESLQRMLPEIPNWITNPNFDRVDWLNKFIELMWPYFEKEFWSIGASVILNLGVRFNVTTFYNLRKTEKLRFFSACRNCDHQKNDDNFCVYRNEIHHSVGEQTQVLQDVVADPTLPRTKVVRCVQCNHDEAVFFH